MLNVRDATPDDAGEVAGVHVRSWQVAYRRLIPDAYLDGLRVEDRATRYTFGDTRPGRPRTVVAVADDTICGFATTGPARDGDATAAGEVYAMYVDPTAWGQGVGRVLMLEARTRLHRQGYDEALLWVLADNERAQRFYRADGWHPDGQRRNEQIGDVTVDEVRYRRRLTR